MLMMREDEEEEETNYNILQQTCESFGLQLHCIKT
jgi:hypothetical protein